jgi:hypothetical protein
MHTQDDAFFLSDRPFTAREGLNILDVAKTVVLLLAPPSAQALDGTALLTS